MMIMIARIIILMISACCECVSLFTFLFRGC